MTDSTAPFGWRLPLLCFATWLAVFCFSSDWSTAPVYAQDGGVKAGSGEPVDQAMADLEQRKRETFLMWMIRSSGPFGAMIGIISFVMVALIMMDGLQLRRDNYLPADFIEEFEQKLNARDLQGAYEAARASESFLGRVLTAGMGRLSRGYDEAIKGMQEVGDDESMAMEHKIGYLSLIGTIAPMLGLLGTVQGMVASFQVIATSATSPKPYLLADGIATALFTTLEGLIVAIPAIVFYSFYKNRLARFLMECGYVSENLMSRFQRPAAPARTGGGTPAAAPTARQE